MMNTNINTSFTPTLYYYEHCPYCIRVLAFLGMAGIDINKKVLANDDEDTPISMIGAKMLPILEKEPNDFMGESLDIIDYLGKVYDFLPLKNTALENRVETALNNNRLSIYGLTMPRWIKLPYEEFLTESAVAYFTQKKTQTIGDFDTALKNTESLSADLYEGLARETALFAELREQKDSIAAIMLFAGLLGVSCVPDFIFPTEADAFMKAISQDTGIQLLTAVE